MPLQVSNPFVLIDDFIMDRLFNPVTWWAEYHFGIDAPKVRNRVIIAGFLLVIFVMMSLDRYIVMTVLLIFLGAAVFTEDIDRSNWIARNKTGKNIARVTHRPLRWVNNVLCIFFLVTSDPSLVGYSWLLNIGAILIFFLGEYLFATDAMPPHYYEHKEAPQL